MLRIVALFLAASCMLLETNVRAQSEAFVTALDGLAARTDLNELIKKVNQPHSPEELRAAVNWLDAKTRSGFGGSRLIYSYSNSLFRTGAEESALIAYLFAMLTSRIDEARCANSSAPNESIRNWEYNLAPIFEHFLGLSLDRRKELISRAAASEESLKARAADAWICNVNGLASIYRSLDEEKENSNHAAQGSTDIPHRSRPAPLERQNIDSMFVSDSAWQVRRRDLIAKFYEQLLALPSPAAR